MSYCPWLKIALRNNKHGNEKGEDVENAETLLSLPMKKTKIKIQIQMFSTTEFLEYELRSSENLVSKWIQKGSFSNPNPKMTPTVQSSAKYLGNQTGLGFTNPSSSSETTSASTASLRKSLNLKSNMKQHKVQKMKPGRKRKIDNSSDDDE